MKQNRSGSIMVGISIASGILGLGVAIYNFIAVPVINQINFAVQRKRISKNLNEGSGLSIQYTRYDDESKPYKTVYYQKLKGKLVKITKDEYNNIAKTGVVH